MSLHVLFAAAAVLAAGKEATLLAPLQAGQHQPFASPLDAFASLWHYNQVKHLLWNAPNKSLLAYYQVASINLHDEIALTLTIHAAPKICKALLAVVVLPPKAPTSDSTCTGPLAMRCLSVQRQQRSNGGLQDPLLGEGDPYGHPAQQPGSTSTPTLNLTGKSCTVNLNCELSRTRQQEQDNCSMYISSMAENATICVYTLASKKRLTHLTHASGCKLADVQLRNTGSEGSSLSRLLHLVVPFTSRAVMEALEWSCKGGSAPALALAGFALLQPSAVSSGTIHICLGFAVQTGLPAQTLKRHPLQLYLNLFWMQKYAKVLCIHH